MPECQTKLTWICSSSAFRSGLTAFPHAVFFNPKSVSSSLSSSLFTFKHRGLSFEQKVFTPSPGHVQTFMLHWVFLHNEVWQAIWKMPWHHDFVTSNLFFYSTKCFYAIPLERSNIANWRLSSFVTGALLSQSQQTLKCGDSKCFQCMPAFTIWHSASNDDGKCYENTWQKINPVLRRHTILRYCLSFLGYFFTLSKPCKQMSRKTWISWWTAWTKGCDDFLRECSLPSFSDLFISAFHISGFCTLILYFCQSCSPEVSMYKSMFLVLSKNWCKISHEKHSHKGPIISVLSVSCIFLR